MRDVVVVAAARTPFGKQGGTLKDYTAMELGGLAIKEAVERAGITGDMVDEVIYGVVVAAGLGQVPGRQAALKAGLPYTVPVLTINKACGSALKAVTVGAQMIKAGDIDVAVVGGMESMSNSPYIVDSVRKGTKTGDVIMHDANLMDGLMCPEEHVHMAVFGGGVAKEYDITREMQDKWAYESQMKWSKGEAKGAFDEERFPITITDRKGNETLFDKDEAPRPNTTMDALSKLKPVFDENGTVTAGNAPGLNDGASAIVLMSREKAEELGTPILATIKDYAEMSLQSRYIATVPGLTVKKLMEKNKLTIKDFDRIEINEAFAAVTLTSCLKILDMTEEEMEAKVNVNGGAVACGHPVGATGARLLMTLIYELKREGLKSGICAICSGMAQGDAVWIEV